MLNVLIRQRFDIEKKITKHEDKQFPHYKIWQKEEMTEASCERYISFNSCYFFFLDHFSDKIPLVGTNTTVPVS